MYFEKGTSITNLMKAVHNPDERLKWDKDIESAEVLSIVNSKMMLWHQINRSPISFVNRRDFLEKKFKFTKGNRQFVIFTSIPDDIQPTDSSTTRAHTILGYHVFEKLDDGRVKFGGIMQTDFKLGTGPMGKVAQTGTLNALPKNMQKWHLVLEAHVKTMVSMVDAATA
jgi:hypothetical protein